MIEELKSKGKYEDDYFVYEVKPARQGMTYGSPRKDGQEKVTKYPLRVKVTAKKELKELINK